MDIQQIALAGTLESSDAQITVEPNGTELSITIQSSVMNQYGRQIKHTIEDTLTKLDVTKGSIKVIDKGALECTIKARLACAIFRSCQQSETNIPWEVL